jgi:hypothetical protein
VPEELLAVSANRAVRWASMSKLDLRGSLDSEKSRCVHTNSTPPFAGLFVVNTLNLLSNLVSNAEVENS